MVIFESNMCSLQSGKDNKVLFMANRSGNIYTVKFDEFYMQNVKYLFALEKVS